MTTTLTRLSREDEESSVVMANAHQTQDGVPPEVNEVTKNERASIACVEQIVAEKSQKTAKQGNCANEAKIAQEDCGTVLVREELANLRNAQNQQKQAMDRLKEKAQHEDSSGDTTDCGGADVDETQGPIISGASGISGEERRKRNKARSSE